MKLLRKGIDVYVDGSQLSLRQITSEAANTASKNIFLIKAPFEFEFEKKRIKIKKRNCFVQRFVFVWNFTGINRQLIWHGIRLVHITSRNQKSMR